MTEFRLQNLRVIEKFRLFWVQNSQRGLFRLYRFDDASSCYLVKLEFSTPSRLFVIPLRLHEYKCRIWL